MTQLITGHEAEMNSFEQIKDEDEAIIAIEQGERIANAGNLLKQAAKGELVPYTDFFGDLISVEQQVAAAKAEISQAIKILTAE